jgi:hypothetical protein
MSSSSSAPTRVITSCLKVVANVPSSCKIWSARSCIHEDSSLKGENGEQCVLKYNDADVRLIRNVGNQIHSDVSQKTTKWRGWTKGQINTNNTPKMRLMMAEINNCGQGVYFTDMCTTRYRQCNRQANIQHGLHNFAQQLPSFTIRGYSLETIPKYTTELKLAIQVTARTSPPPPSSLKQLQSRSQII